MPSIFAIYLRCFTGFSFLTTVLTAVHSAKLQLFNLEGPELFML